MNIPNFGISNSKIQINSLHQFNSTLTTNNRDQSSEKEEGEFPPDEQRDSQSRQKKDN